MTQPVQIQINVGSPYLRYRNPSLTGSLNSISNTIEHLQGRGDGTSKFGKYNNYTQLLWQAENLQRVVSFQLAYLDRLVEFDIKKVKELPIEIQRIVQSYIDPQILINLEVEKIKDILKGWNKDCVVLLGMNYEFPRTYSIFNYFQNKTKENFKEAYLKFSKKRNSQEFIELIGSSLEDSTTLSSKQKIHFIKTVLYLDNDKSYCVTNSKKKKRKNILQIESLMTID